MAGREAIGAAAAGAEMPDDMAALSAYLSRAADDESILPPPGFFTVSAVVETMSQLRILAEGIYRNAPLTAKDNRRELPLNWTDAYEIIFHREMGPPQTTITMIAERFSTTLTLLLTRLRRQLRRERQMVPLSQARQLDAQCMRWLSRQPGVTVADKAGGRQRIMAVVRAECVDTPENRVLKGFLLQCQLSSDEYLRKYAPQFPGADRIGRLRRLQALVTAALSLPDLAAVAPYGFLPPPNYVLRYDPLYSEMWRWHERLMRQLRVITMVWPYRHQLLDEFMRLALEAQLQQYSGWSPSFCNQLWLAFLPEKGRFLRQVKWDNLFFREKDGEELQVTGNGQPPLSRWLWRNGPRRASCILSLDCGGCRDGADAVGAAGHREVVHFLSQSEGMRPDSQSLYWRESEEPGVAMKRIFNAIMGNLRKKGVPS